MKNNVRRPNRIDEQMRVANTLSTKVDPRTPTSVYVLGEAKAGRAFEPYHRVDIEFPTLDSISVTCQCAWTKHNGIACKHVFAGVLALAEARNYSARLYADRVAAERQRKRLFTIRQRGEVIGFLVLRSRQERKAA